MKFVLSWIVEKAVKEEVENISNNAFELANETDIPDSSNIMPSHSVFKIKENKRGVKKLKEHLCRQENRDKYKD